MVWVDRGCFEILTLRNFWHFFSSGLHSGSNDIMFCFDADLNWATALLHPQWWWECHLEFWNQFLFGSSLNFFGADFYQIRMAAINCAWLLALWVLHLSCCRKWPQPTAGHILTPTQLHKQPLHTLAFAGWLLSSVHFLCVYLQSIFTRMAAINCPRLLALRRTPTQVHRQPLHTLASAGPLPCPFSSEYLHKEICVHIGCICFGLF